MAIQARRTHIHLLRYFGLMVFTRQEGVWVSIDCDVGVDGRLFAQAMGPRTALGERLASVTCVQGLSLAQTYRAKAMSHHPNQDPRVHEKRSTYYLIARRLPVFGNKPLRALRCATVEQ